MDNTKTELLEKIKAANTVLITVSRNPSVDGLAACIGMALLLSKLKKHATAVFSGEIPSTLEFLKPEQTLEKTPDSLRDFIISLDRNKADKLRYKVEDKVVKIFITPYRTSINEDDLEFSQGDFNVDLVITLGVQSSDDLDQAISNGGNVLHDATIVSISTATSNIGAINWSVPQASSLCELVAELATSLGDKLFDEQIATALLTGIVAETQRFSNDKTTSLTMSLSSQLMAAGANQQLVASELGDTNATVAKQSKQNVKEPGELDIHHGSDDEDTKTDDQTALPIPSDDSDTPNNDLPVAPDDGAQPIAEDKTPQPEDTNPPSDQSPVTDVQPPADTPDTSAAPTDQVSEPSTMPPPISGSPATPAGFTPPPPSWVPPFSDNDLKTKVDAELADPSATLANIEESVDSPHLKQTPPPATSEPPESPAPPAAPVNNLKDQLNQIIPQVSPDMAASSPSASSVAADRVESDIDPNDLKPPTDPKAPPYPPPIVPTS